MTTKEREKHWFATIKDLSKKRDWKFKRFFIYKVVNNFFYVAYFSPHKDGKQMSVWLEFKPVQIDDLFWTIADLPGNIKYPLSFRAEAAFRIRSGGISSCKIEISNELNPNKEIESILNDLENQVIATSQNIKTSEQFLQILLENEKTYTDSIVTVLTHQGDYLNALRKIDEYKEREMQSWFRFDDKDYLDLVKEYCLKRYC